MRRLFIAATAALALAACNNGQTTTAQDPNATQNATSQTTQQVLADTVTQAIYSNNPDGVTANLVPFVAYGVRRSEVGMLSDKMHALGSYKGLTLLSADNAKHETTYHANFDKGNLTVIVRDGGNGKLAAYRVASN